ncbi:MAG: ATP-dependent DNA ligase [Fervidicoccaceae archaeon]
MDFKLIAETLDMLEKTSSRIASTNILVELFRKTPAPLIDKVVYFLQGKLWPEWRGLPELGLGEKLIIKAISLALNIKEQQVVEFYKREGDLGKVTEQLMRMKPSTTARGLAAFIESAARAKLDVARVYDILARIALAQGEGSRDLKLRLLAGLLKDSEPIEARFIVRFVEGRHRVGVGDMTIIDALALAYAGGSDPAIIERAYNLRADLGAVAKLLVERGIEALLAVTPQVGVPVKPMLAERHKDPKEMLSKVGGRAFVELKYDGERAQIHKSSDGSVILFSRRMENITGMFPDVVEAVREALVCKEAIVEGEIVAVDPETGDMRPFQQLMTRKRKHDVQRAMKEVPVKLFLFDAIYCDGQDLTTRPLPERREILESIVRESESVKLSEYIVVENAEELERFFMKAVESGAEGVMVKAVHAKSVYQAGSRGWLWIKYKRDYRSEMIDTVDLVVVGAFYGRGKRAGKLSTLLMAAYDAEEDVYKTVCKVGTGFTDEDLARMESVLGPYIVREKPPRVVSDLVPDVWVEPVLVAEIIGAELTLSPTHTCGRDRVGEGTGISIRFPRFLRWRDDKRAEDATTCRELVEMYRSQLRKVEEEPITAAEASTLERPE